MGLFKSKTDENWKINYIREFNEMRSEYEKKLLSKQASACFFCQKE